MASTNSYLFGRAKHDRLERLLDSCLGYYHAGDNDISMLLLLEAQSELLKMLPDDALLRVGETRDRALSKPKSSVTQEIPKPRGV